MAKSEQGNATPKPVGSADGDPARPWTYPTRLLLAVSGLSPQIVTETYFAVAVKNEPPFVPTEVHLVTTAEGAQHARRALLHPDTGHFGRLLADYGLEGKTLFPDDNIHVIRDRRGNEIPDLRTAEENIAAADLITALLRQFTSNPDCAVHVSLAGGRKTMGFYVGYAISLFGREQDRLSHVLVSPGFESNKDFFYPSRQRRVLHLESGQPLDTAKAGVTLAEIPFVRLREGLPDSLLDGMASFRQIVDAAQMAIERVSLKLDPSRSTLECGGRAVQLPARFLAEYGFFAWRAMTGLPPIGIEDLVGIELVTFYELFSARKKEAESLAHQRGRDFEKGFFQETVSRVNRALRTALGREGAKPYQIVVDRARRGLPAYQIGIRGDRIQFVGMTASDFRTLTTKAARNFGVPSPF